MEPEWEARFEPRSYGFRPGRGCQDAIRAIYEVAKGKRPKRQWALEADLAGAFDRIAHDHILAMLGSFPARGMIAQWLKAGVVEQGRLHRTEDGVPPIRYAALRECLGILAVEARKLRATIHMPRIGCGLAGGKWESVEPLIRIAIPTIEVFVYDLPPTVKSKRDGH